ncbi:MAG: Coenzyme F420 hydrogenase/dehydrogenase, beta subunit C-terminal domain, partial [Anaerovoracaceae bacterium]
MIHLAEKNQCTGCAACYNSCPKSAISMKPDNGGFLYPYINDELCIKCNQCSKSCPVISPLISKSEYEPRAFVAQHKDDDIRKESTSGGAFTALAQIVIENGGVVFGASMEDGFVVKHTLATTIDELAKFRNSKYVQSEIGKSFSAVKEYLEKGIQVLFSGTPCQIEGLLGYLHEKYNNLVTVDIVCHSIPSPAVFKKYMDLQISKYPQVDKVVFRDKQRGYDYSTIALYGKKKTDDKKCFYRRGSESDLWFRSFLPGLCDRENCYNCYFQEYPRKSDITIWDCFAISDIYPEFDDNAG